MATLTPSFHDFLPVWVAAQSWYLGSGRPSLALVGTYRLEDPAGEAGIETHLVRDGTTTYQVPMTFRGAPFAAAGDRAGPVTPALIAVAGHSELGTRWIYDAEGDPVWRGEITRLVRDGRTVESRTGDGDVVTAVTGYPLNAAELAGSPAIELRRVLAPGEPPSEPPADAAGLVMGTWRADGFRSPGFPLPGAETVTGCLAVLRA